jgi:hypothetical protein
MKALEKIKYVIALLGIVLTVSSCSNESDAVLTNQQKAIETYLTSSHNPRLIEESKIYDSLDDQPQFYTRWGMNIYRYIATFYDKGRDERKEITRGTTFEMRYNAYIFTNGNPERIENLYATNDAKSIQELKDEGLNAEYEWSSEPMRIKLGYGNMIGGLDTALEGCREGDIVEVYLTYDAAYGKQYIGKLPSKSAVAWFIEILKVE